LAVGLTACGGGAAPGPGDNDGSTTTAAGTEPESIAAFFGFPTGDDPEAAQAFYQAQETRIQEMIRTCMAEQGFEYIPAVYPQPDIATMEFDQIEYARTQGFGITTWYGNEEQFSGPEVDWVDPNQALIEAMSESEMEAYYEALHGPPMERETSSDGETLVTMSGSGFGSGCYGEASEEVYGNQNQVYEVMSAELEDMYARVQADPRIAEANSTWAGCMSERGFSYESTEQMYTEVYEDFQQRFDAIVGPNGGYVDPMEGWTDAERETFFTEKSQEEIEAFFAAAQNEAEQDIDQEALAELQQEEKDLAVANAECSADMNDLYTELYKEYETQFITDHRARLEEIRDGQGG
jgi:hypothetical protein